MHLPSITVERKPRCQNSKQGSSSARAPPLPPPPPRKNVHETCRIATRKEQTGPLPRSSLRKHNNTSSRPPHLVNGDREEQVVRLGRLGTDAQPFHNRMHRQRQQEGKPNPHSIPHFTEPMRVPAVSSVSAPVAIIPVRMVFSRVKTGVLLAESSPSSPSRAHLIAAEGASLMAAWNTPRAAAVASRSFFGRRRRLPVRLFV